MGYDITITVFYGVKVSKETFETLFAQKPSGVYFIQSGDLWSGKNLEYFLAVPSTVKDVEDIWSLDLSLPAVELGDFPIKEGARWWLTKLGG